MKRLNSSTNSSKSFKISKGGVKQPRKLADIVSRTKSDVEFYEKHSHKFMITESLQKMLKKESKKKPKMLGADLFFSNLISDKMETADGTPFEFNTNKQVKINKMKHIQKDLLFTSYQMNEMDYRFDKTRFMNKKRETNGFTDNPDMARAGLETDMNVSFSSIQGKF